MRTPVLFTAALIAMIAANFALAEWTSPVPMPGVSTQYQEGIGRISPDGLTFYFTRGVCPANDAFMLYQATRTSATEQFGNVSRINTITSSGNISDPWASQDNLRLYYYVREGGSKLKMSSRTSATQAWSSGEYVTSLNNWGPIQNPNLTTDELTMVFSSFDSRSWSGGFDLYTASRTDRNSAWTNIRPLTTINTSSQSEALSYMSADGLTLYYLQSAINTGWQTYMATRNSVTDDFGNIHLTDIVGSVAGFDLDGLTRYTGNNWDMNVSTYVPEPATLATLALGGLLLRRKQKSR